MHPAMPHVRILDTRGVGGKTWRVDMLNKSSLFLSLLGAAVIATSPLAASAQEVLGKGTFTGKSGHRTSGSVTIVRTGNSVEVRLGSNFKLDGAPDPWLGFGNNGKYVSASEISKLKSNSGAQVYKISGPVDVSKYSEFYIWCRKFSVPLGVAKLK
jgi:Electron transfer DM13